MADYTAPWFYGSTAMTLLQEAETTLSKFWVIPLEVPWNAFTLASGCMDISRFMSDTEKFAVICPAMWSWFSVYDSSTGYGVLAGNSLHKALETWAANTDTMSVVGFVHSNQGVRGQVLIQTKSAACEDITEFVQNVEKQYNS